MLLKTIFNPIRTFRIVFFVVIVVVLVWWFWF